MTIKSSTGQRTINLDGPDGNAMVLIGMARTFAKQVGLDAKAITEDMMSSDYTHLVKVFDQHFGMVVTLETANPELLKQLGESKQQLNG